MAKLTHLETQEIISDIYVLNTKNANFYIIKNESRYIAIDAGGGSRKRIEAELNKLSIDPEKITTVLLTHTDFDHLAGLNLFKNATIYISREEVQMINGSVARMFGFFKNKLNVNYKVIKNNKIIHFSKIKVKGILTPGHTNGSMCYLVDDKYLFTGDNLSLYDGQVDLFNSLFNMDDDVQRKSIKKLARIKGAEYIFTSHHGFSDNYTGAFGKFE